MSQPQVHSGAEIIKSIRKSNYPIGSRNHDLPPPLTLSKHGFAINNICSVTVGIYATCVRVGIGGTAPRAQKICTQGRCVISIRPWLSYPQRQCVHFRFSRALDWPKFRSAEVEKKKTLSLPTIQHRFPGHPVVGLVTIMTELTQI